LDDPTRVETIARNIIGALSRSYNFDRRPARVTVSIGITFYPEDGMTVDTLMACADQAMYEAKHAGRNRFSFYIPGDPAAHPRAGGLFFKAMAASGGAYLSASADALTMPD